MPHLDTFDWNQMYTGRATDCSTPDPLVLSIVDTLAPGRALDVGCGAGGMLAALADRGWQIAGVDIASRAIDAARAALEARGVAAELHVADAAEWAPDGAFDLVVSTFALPGSAERRARAFAMMRAAVVPGGTVLIKDFDATMKAPEFLPSHDMVTVDELARAFAGLEVARCEIVPTPVHDHAGAHRQHERWTAALLVATRPS